MIEKNEELSDAAGEIVRDTVNTLQELGVEQDFAAYLMLCAGLGLAVLGNRNSPIIVKNIRFSNKNFLSIDKFLRRSLNIN